jgi:hypothetical protein
MVILLPETSFLELPHAINYKTKFIGKIKKPAGVKTLS